MIFILRDKAYLTLVKRMFPVKGLSLNQSLLRDKPYLALIVEEVAQITMLILMLGIIHTMWYLYKVMLLISHSLKGVFRSESWSIKGCWLNESINLMKGPCCECPCPPPKVVVVEPQKAEIVGAHPKYLVGDTVNVTCISNRLARLSKFKLSPKS